MPSELLQLGNGVGFGHGIHQAVVPYLQLDLLQGAGHGGAWTRPLTVDVNDCQSTLKLSHLKIRTIGLTLIILGTLYYVCIAVAKE